MELRSFVSSFLFIVILCLVSVKLSISSENPEVFIVHMLKSEKPHLFSTHHDWYSSIIHRLSPLSRHSSKLLYNYDTVVHGFSARLTPSQAFELRNIPGVISVLPDRIRQLHTTRSPQFLGLLDSSGLWPSSDYGDGVIIGVLDTGIWPEGRRSFSDKGLSPAPSSWKGICEDSTDFPADTLCNNKIIGARAFYEGYEAMFGTIDESVESKSPRDITGHGTHTASIAAGSSVTNAGFFGYAQGEARGIAVKARVAVYKSCWLLGCVDSDILAAMDQALEDGVRVISISIGEAGGTKQYYDDNIAIGAFGAMQRGVLVSFSASNSGPGESTVENIPPWIITVGASTIDRQFPADVTLGDDRTFTGASLYSADPLGENKLPVVYGGDANSTFCYSGELDASIVGGKIVFCEPGGNADVAKGIAVKDAGGVGMIIPNAAGKDEELIANGYLLPALNVDETDGYEIRDYIKSNPSPTATIVFRGTVIGTQPSAPRVAAFSGRGPNRITPEILKPDVIAPGVNILAAWTDATSPTRLDIDDRRVEFNIISGASIACPHVSGLAAMLRKVHPEWSPAAIKSALMTTAYTVDNFGNYLIDQSSGAPSNPYIHGSGHVNAITASDPGLVYDLEVSDYVDFLCTIGYNTQQISLFVKDSTVDCSTRQLGTPGNLNYPAFSVVYYDDETLVEYKRTVKNVGSKKDVVYSVTVDAPEDVQVSVSPTQLVFNKMTDTLSYQVSFSSTGSPGYDTYGSITWEDDDQMYIVTSPIVVHWMTTSQSTL